MSKIIGLVALSIPGSEAIERLLIACVRPDTHANSGMPIFFSFASHHRHDNDRGNNRSGGGERKLKKKICRVKVEVQYTECFGLFAIPVLDIYFSLSLPLSHTFTNYPPSLLLPNPHYFNEYSHSMPRVKPYHESHASFY